ncbi:hypothetical protein [Atopobium fossor]|uniref:hypothetical protein n=1 Tax=Atopobium fossor TaxID=39487 RepID=UPI000429173B|nr:hypothetical protein [Atopobium fossor]
MKARIKKLFGTIKAHPIFTIVLIASVLYTFGPYIYFVAHPLLIPIEYQLGPNAWAAANQGTFDYDRREYGLEYKLEYEDKDSEGNVRYHFISTGGENVPKVITAEFEWQDEWSVELMLPVYHPAGWYYYGADDRDEWEEAFIKWIESPTYDGRELPYKYRKYAHTQ